MNSLKILLIHGIGNIEANLSWDAEWKKIIEGSIKALNPTSTVSFQAVKYDEIFEKTEIDPVAVAEALAQLSTSGVCSWVGDIFKRRRGITDALQWTLGMVAKWASDDKLRADLRKVVLKSINEFDPMVICAHSLGSLIAYDSFAQTPNSVNGRYFMSFGSQIGNPFIRSLFGGRIVPLDAKYWYHLYSKEDAVATAPIQLSAENFEQVDTYFDIPGIADHSSAEYLKHPNTTNLVWKSIVTQRPKTTARMLKALVAAPQQRALLVGINDYPNPADRLEGCVNDVYLMSSVLQECGLPPENIRVVLNERATVSGIKERMEWLLEDTKPGDYRFLFYSGHGAQIPDYGASNEVDHSKECLVPYDFAWSAETAIVDDWLCDLYSQLPYEVNFIALLDCCHSGGMTRNGSLTVRGLNPPDDIRHRSLRWEQKLSMWVPRDLKLAAKDVAEPDVISKPILVRQAQACDWAEPFPCGLRRNILKRQRKRTDISGHILPLCLRRARKENILMSTGTA